MARQTGDIIIVGTIDDITFYRMEGRGYARSKSCLKGERVKRDPRFKRTMQSARRLGKGSQLASIVYRSLPREEQMYKLFKELKRIAILAIKQGKGEAEVLTLLRQRVERKPGVKKAKDARAWPYLRCKEGPINKTLRLFRVCGGQAIARRRHRVKERWRLRPGVPSRSVQRHQQSRE